MFIPVRKIRPALFALCVFVFAPDSAAIVTSNNFDVIQQIVGADRFYDNGYYGFNAIVANVEAGHVWNKHEVFATPVGNGVFYTQDPSVGLKFPTYQYDWHATAVGAIMTGIGPYDPENGYYYYQLGMAPGATLISSAIGTAFEPNSGQFDITNQSFNFGYTSVMRDGVMIDYNYFGLILTIQATADVINSSWGFEDTAGIFHETMTIDALVASTRKVVCIAAGNESAAVSGPASGFNNISVGALSSDITGYKTVADFSNVLPNDFVNPKTGQNYPAIRAGVDIVAPGTDIISAAYTGKTGSNAGGTDPSPGAIDLYYIGIDGTSFASPIVAGGAALMVDASYSMTSPKAKDALVIKANLLNSATKIEGWTNDLKSINGVLVTTQALDYASGAGALNLYRAYDQYLLGDKDLPGLVPGAIHDVGWDYANVSLGMPNDYFFIDSLKADEELNVTLDWMIHRIFKTDGTSEEGYYNDLDLQVWRVVDGQMAQLIAESRSLYSNVEHLHFDIPQDGYYALRVVFFSNTFDMAGTAPMNEDYAIAWSVPEPGAMLWLGACGVLLMRRKR